MFSRLPLESHLSENTDPSQRLREELKDHLSTQDFATWFEGTPFDFHLPNRFVLRLQNGFRKTWIEKNYRELLRNCARTLFDFEVRIDFEIDQGLSDAALNNASSGEPISSNRIINDVSLGDAAKSIQPSLRSPRASQNSTPGAEKSVDRCEFPRALHRDFVFESLMVGCTNSVAHAAALAVCANPARAYNPLLLCGDSDVGKTHLLHAMCHSLLASKTSRLAFMTTEDFLRRCSHSRDSRSPSSIRKLLRETEILVMDDIHVLAGQEACQEEFFTVFNHLMEQGKQVILASRRPQAAWNELQSRLTSRFRSGLIARMDSHGPEMRIGILILKARLRNVDLPVEVADYLASTSPGGIRELEGALLRVIHLSNVQKRPIDILLAQSAQIAWQNNTEPAGAVTIDRIIRTVQAFYRLRSRDLLSRSKARSLALPRQLGMFLARQMTQLSLVDIGASFGGRDHTTVIYAQERVQALIQTTPQVREDLQTLKDLILSPGYHH